MEDNEFLLEVRGIMYRPKKTHKLIDKYVDTGTMLFLEREPENKYDEHAVKVLYDDELIGYVEGESSEEISKMLSTCKDYECRVESCFIDVDFDVSESGKDIEIITDIDMYIKVVFEV